MNRCLSVCVCVSVNTCVLGELALRNGTHIHVHNDNNPAPFCIASTATHAEEFDKTHAAVCGRGDGEVDVVGDLERMQQPVAANVQVLQNGPLTAQATGGEREGGERGRQTEKRV